MVVFLNFGFDQASADRPPSVVVLLADDLGSADLSCTGSLETQTPRLDRLASEGVQLTDFHAASAVCSPSRAALLTGRFPVRVGVYSWIHTSHRMHLRVEETTLAERLRTAGFDTAHVGKWHLSYDLVDGEGPNPDPSDHGFDHWMATGNNATPSHHNPINFVRNGKALGVVEGYSCDIVVAEALDWLERRSDPEQPFYLNVWFHEPHQKVAAPPNLMARHAETDLPAYYGSIENMDRAIGRLLDALDRLGVADETMVIFTSDNGSYRRGSNGKLRGRKGQLWQGGIRVPGIIRWPGRIAAGSVESTPTGIVDLLPTILDATGQSAPTDKTLDGVSLLPLFSGASIERARPLLWFYNPSQPTCVLRDDRWCLVADTSPPLPTNNLFREAWIGQLKDAELTDFRLFDLEADPGQTLDVSAQHPETFARLRRLLIDGHRKILDEAHDWRDDPERPSK